MPEPSLYLQYSFLVPAAITVAGWIVVARQTDRREYRKEVRDQLKDLRTSIDEVRSKVTGYWLEPDVKKAAAAAIALKSELKRLSRLTRTLASAGLDYDHATLVAEVRSLATGGEFESKKRSKTADDAGRIEDVAGALEELLTAVDVAFYAEFKPARASGLWRWFPLLGALLLTKD